MGVDADELLLLGDVVRGTLDAHPVADGLVGGVGDVDGLGLLVAQVAAEDQWVGLGVVMRQSRIQIVQHQHKLLFPRPHQIPLTHKQINPQNPQQPHHLPHITSHLYFRTGRPIYPL